MATTSHITNIADKLDLTAYAGDFIDDYDMDAVRDDFVDRINETLPAGVTLARNGDVYADVEVAEEARDIDWAELTDGVSVDDIFERHDRTAKLLPAVAESRAAIEQAERAHITAVRVAKNSKRFTVDQIAETAGITRDGVYKMLSRSRPTITFSSAEQAQWLAQHTELVANGHRVDVDGSTVTLTSEGLDVLADFDEEDDGHYDGTYVWIGGTEYRVEG